MLTHALLPHGIGVSMSLHAGSASVSALCSQGPSCDAGKFPAKHGLHGVRGEYTEIERVSVGGASFRVETAATGDGSGDLNVLITTLSLPAAGAAAAMYVDVELAVPEPYKPRVCEVTGAGASLRGECPGLPSVTVAAGSGSPLAPGGGASGTIRLALSSAVSGQISLRATTLPSPEAPSHAAIRSAVATARKELLNGFAKYGARNETFAGMQTSISWNVIYTPVRAAAAVGVFL